MSTRRSVSRLDDSYACTLSRAWISLILNADACASRLEIQRMRE